MNQPTVLHVINSFAKNSFYVKLVGNLDGIGISQIIYSATRTDKEATYSPTEISHLPIFCHNILKWYDVIFFRNKINKIFKDICKHINPDQISLTHAHTLYTDGAVAFNLKKVFNIPFIVAVRGGDIKAFNKLRPDLVLIRNEVLMQAEKIIFLTPFYRDLFLSQLNGKIRKKVSDTCTVIPNGIDAIYLESGKELDRELKKKSMSSNNPELKLLYVGRFLKQKNIPKLIEAVARLSKKKHVTLTIVGEGGDQEEKVKQMFTSKKYPFITYLGNIQNKEQLLNLYRSHDIFVMVSWQETFGLVYAEALSQGVPVVLASGEGLDGYFEENSITEKVQNPHDINEIAQAIERLSNRLGTSLSKKCIDESKQFNWPDLSKKYKEMYTSLSNK
ncbi:MAG: glycosyltransferase family 4 protein [Balneolales bacterium]